MSLSTRWMTLGLATAVVAVLVLAFAATPAVSSASNAAGNDVARPTVGVAAALDALPPGGTTEPTLAGLQMMDDDGDFWNGWWIIMPIMMLVFWGGVIALVVWGIRQFTQDRDRGGSALDIAKERYARGDIIGEQFEQIRRDLENS